MLDRAHRDHWELFDLWRAGSPNAQARLTEYMAHSQLAGQ